MATAKQIKAARENAKRSTGPRTQAGKAASSQNALKHGLTAANPITLPGESPETLEAMLADYSRQFQPRNLMERDLVQQLAVASWNLERSWKLEAAQMRTEMVRGEDALTAEFGLVDDNIRLAAAFEKSAHQISLLLRYRAQHERAYHRALKTLLELRKNDVFAGNPRLYESHETRYVRAVAEQNRREANPPLVITTPPLAICETNPISNNSSPINDLPPHCESERGPNGVTLRAHSQVTQPRSPDTH